MLEENVKRDVGSEAAVVIENAGYASVDGRARERFDALIVFGARRVPAGYVVWLWLANAPSANDGRPDLSALLQQ